jgi:hypothetical protein
MNAYSLQSMVNLKHPKWWHSFYWTRTQQDLQQTESLSLREFLQSRTTNKDVLLTSLHFQSIHQEVIEIVEAGGNMWQERNCPFCLSPLQTHYCQCYSAVATNNHLAECGVKSANLCSVDGRLERLESAYGTSPSGLVEEIHLQMRLAHQEQENQSGNQYVFSGSVNARKRKIGMNFKMMSNGS